MSQLPVQPEPVNRDVAVAQAQNLGAGMKQQGIKAIEFENGTRAEYDSKTDTTTVAGNGTIVKDTPLTTTVTTIKLMDQVDAKKEVYGSEINSNNRCSTEYFSACHFRQLSK